MSVSAKTEIYFLSLEVRPRPNNNKMARQPTFIQLSRRKWQADYAGRRTDKIVREKCVAEKAQLILYTKPGCHLCDEMKREIQRAGCAALFELDEVNIETDSDLLARYRDEIPVLLIDGVEAFRHRLRAMDFKTKLCGRQS
jgi:glutaredoxin